MKDLEEEGFGCNFPFQDTKHSEWHLMGADGGEFIYSGQFQSFLMIFQEGKMKVELASFVVF